LRHPPQKVVFSAREKGFRIENLSNYKNLTLDVNCWNIWPLNKRRGELFERDFELLLKV